MGRHRREAVLLLEVYVRVEVTPGELFVLSAILL